MPSRFQSLAATMVSSVPTMLILAALAALGIWGAQNDWKFSRLPMPWGKTTALEEKTPPETIRVIADPAAPTPDSTGSPTPPLMRIEFPSVEAVKKAGI